MDYRETIDGILANRTSGSSEIAEAIESVFPHIPTPELQQVTGKIVTTHSSMASVINRVNRLCLLREGKKAPIPQNRTTHVFEKFWWENRERKKWVTLSMSGWVIRLLKHSRWDLDINVGISYPDLEGEVTLKALNHQHRVTLYEDTRLCAQLEHVDGVILGSDLITKDAVINKTGSFALALAAAYFKKPLYIIGSGDKFLSPELEPFFKLKIEARGQRLIHYFEKVPRRLTAQVYLTSTPWQFPLSSILQATPPANKRKSLYHGISGYSIDV